MAIRNIIVLGFLAGVSLIGYAAEDTKESPVVIHKEGALGQVDVGEAANPKSIEELAGGDGAGGGATVATNGAAPTVLDLEPVVEAMQLMIEQQRLALDSLERARADAVAGAKQNAEATEVKLSRLEETLEAQRTAMENQRAQESETVNRMNRLVVAVAAGFAGTGFVVMVLTAWYFMRTMNQVAEINANLQSRLLALPGAQTRLVGDSGAEVGGSQRLLGALEQLERRIRDLEQTASPGTPEPVDLDRIEPAEVFSVPAYAKGQASGEGGFGDEQPSVRALLAKGQTLLNLDDAGQALACFETALRQEPDNVDALLKKGTALERLQRMQEALETYDAALRLDDSLTTAYLAKGGICNKLERYAEALECYERALRVQQQGVA